MAQMIPWPDESPGGASTGYGRQNSLLGVLMLGYTSVKLTNMGGTNTNSVCRIAAGSVFEANGILYRADADEDITGTLDYPANYIYAVPSGGTISFVYMNRLNGGTLVYPVWNYQKHGWYRPGTNERAVGIFESNGVSQYKGRVLYGPNDDVRDLWT